MAKWSLFPWVLRYVDRCANYVVLLPNSSCGNRLNASPSWSATPIPPDCDGESDSRRQRDRAGASIGTSTSCPPLARQRESSSCPHVPCEHRTDPAEPPPATQPHRDSATIARPATQPAPKNLNPSAKRKPKRPIPKDQQIATHHARTGGSGIGPERALERRHPDPPSRAARKLLLSQRSLRAQARSRGASPRLSPIATQPHGRTRNTATHPAPTRSPRPPALTHDASEPLRVLCRK